MLKRMSMVGDGLAHGVLPGLVLGFLFTHSRELGILLIGGLLAALLLLALVQSLALYSPLKSDSALAVVFTGFFALGVLLISRFAAQVDIDAECVLFGELGYIALAPAEFWGMPSLALRLSLALLLSLCCSCLFYRLWLLCSFDAAFARSTSRAFHSAHYALMLLTAVVVLCAFEASGSILTVAMLIFPPASARLFSKSCRGLLVGSLFFALAYSLGGYYLAFAFNSGVASGMGVFAFALWMVLAIGQRTIKSCF